MGFPFYPPVVPPLTAVLDNFDRADESPISYGGRWVSLFGGNSMQVLSNACLSEIGSGSAAWVAQQYTAFEVYVTCATQGNVMRLFGRMADLGATADGYLANFTNGTTSIQRVDNAALTTLASTTAYVPQNNDMILFRGIGATLESFFRRGATWTRLIGASDATYTTGFLGLGATGTTAVFDNFGGGTISNPNIARPEYGFGAA